MRNFTIYDILKRNVKNYADKDAVVDGDLRWTFSDYFSEVNAFAAGLNQQGIQKGARIGILAQNSHHFFTLLGAASALGLILVPINWRLSDEEIDYILSDSAPEMIFADSNFAQKAKDICENHPGIKLFFWNVPGSGANNINTLSVKDASGPDAEVAGNDPLCLIYTAAVEGRPRGAVLSHANFIYGNMQTAVTMALGPSDANINMLPLFHITGLNLALATMHAGGKNVVIPKFDENEVLKQTEAEQASLWGSFPPMLGRLTEAVDKGNYNIASLRHVMGLDGPDNIRPFEEKTGAVFWILYGQTETSGLVTFGPASEQPGAAGKVGVLTKMKLADEEDNEVPVGETGEITVQGPLVFHGFWQQDDLNEQTFRNGWHHTGDNGQLDENGYLWFKGRKPEKELIKPGGENVYPAEVEAVVLEHPEVAEVSVIGVPDPKFGEGIKAVCVLEPGADVTPESLIEFVASRIARYKKPRYVAFADDLPKKADGNIDREKVKALFGE